MFKRTNYSGYLLENRAETLSLLASCGIPPAFERVVLEHVTYRYPDRETAPAATSVRIVGHASKDGVQALLVEVDGSIHRPTGGLFHLTYSLSENRKPKESNALLEESLLLGSITQIDPIDLAVTAF